MARGEQFIFVGGAARSGTTLVQNILDSYPYIIGGPEFRNIPSIIKLRNELHESIALGKTVVFSNSYDDIDNQIYALIENLLTPLLKKHNCKMLSEKSCANVLVFPELFKVFPGAHFIHVIRDPRASIMSNMIAREKFRKKGIKKNWQGVRQTEGKLLDFINVIKMVKKFILAGLASSRIAPEKVLTVVYEKLVNDPEGETKKICSFLGIEWSSQMVNPSSKKHIGEESTTREKGWYTPKSYNRDPDPACANKWKSQMTFFQKVLIVFYFRDMEELAHYGYDMTAQSWREKALLKIFLYYKKLSNNMKMSKVFLYFLKNKKVFSGYRDETHVL